MKTIEHIIKDRTVDAIIAILCAFMLIAIGLLHAKNMYSPVSIPAAIELQWAADSSWTGGWK